MENKKSMEAPHKNTQVLQNQNESPPKIPNRKVATDYNRSEAKTVEINLDLPAIERWRVLTPEQCKLIRDNKESYTTRIFTNFFKGDSQLFQKFQEESVDFLMNRADPEMRDELIGLADHCQVSYDYMILYNYVYEFEILGCTSILYRSKATGDVTLASNLDYNYFDIYSPLTVRGIFKKSGCQTIEASLILGFIGYSRAAKGELGFALNARNPRTEEEKHLVVDKLREHFRTGEGIQTVYFLRIMIQNSDSYEQLEQIARDIYILSYAFIILRNKKEGLIIARDPKGVFGTTRLGEDGLDYLVQTNRDRDQIHDDERRRVGQEKMTSILDLKSEASSEDLMTVLSTEPNFMLIYVNGLLEFRTISTSIHQTSSLSVGDDSGEEYHDDNSGGFVVYLWGDKDKANGIVATQSPIVN